MRCAFTLRRKKKSQAASSEAHGKLIPVQLLQDANIESSIHSLSGGQEHIHDESMPWIELRLRYLGFREPLPTLFYTLLTLFTCIGIIPKYPGLSSNEYTTYPISAVALNARQQILADQFSHVFLFKGEKFWHHICGNLSHVQIVV
ncbi:hypothetical protein Trydic_g13282 [Trypoxylus dichotomus]